MTYVIRHTRTLDLLDGNIGTVTGKAIAGYLRDINRLDVLDGFYDWVDSSHNNQVKRLYNWLADNHRDLHSAFLAREKIMGRKVHEWA